MIRFPTMLPIHCDETRVKMRGCTWQATQRFVSFLPIESSASNSLQCIFLSWRCGAICFWDMMMRVCGTFSCQTQTPFTLIMTSQGIKSLPILIWSVGLLLKFRFVNSWRECKSPAKLRVPPGAAEVENPHRWTGASVLEAKKHEH